MKQMRSPFSDGKINCEITKDVEQPLQITSRKLNEEKSDLASQYNCLKSRRMNLFNGPVRQCVLQ